MLLARELSVQPRASALLPLLPLGLPQVLLPIQRSAHAISSKLVCCSNRLQQLVPVVPAVDLVEAEQLHPATQSAAAPTDLGRIATSQLDLQDYNAVGIASAGVVAPQQHEGLQRIVDSGAHASSHPATSAQQSAFYTQQHQDQLQQLQLQPQFDLYSDNWTASQDDDILSAAADLPKEAIPTDGTFVGNRFTFSNSGGVGEATHAAVTERQAFSKADKQRNYDADALQQQLEAIDLELQQAVAFAGLDDSSSSDSSSTTDRLQDAIDDQAAARAAAADAEFTLAAVEVATGQYFSSRGSMLQQLQQQQLHVQRDYLLNKQRKNLYNYTISDSGRIIKRSKPGPKNPLAQTTFALAKRQPEEPPAAADGAGELDDSSSSSSSSSSIDPGMQQHSTVRQQQQRMQQMYPLDEVEQPTGLESSGLGATERTNSSSGRQSSSRYRDQLQPTTSTHLAAAAAGDPSRGLCLSIFLYCCSQSKLLGLTWQLGLPPNALKFVSRVADADVVLHVKPRAGEKHFHYEAYRDQSSKKGIPVVDLKNLSLQELGLYLLPVFKLYAGEVSPRDLLKRKKARGWKKRYTNIKLPPA